MNKSPTPAPKLIPFPNVNPETKNRQPTHNHLPWEQAEALAGAVGRKVMRHYGLTSTEAMPIFFFTLTLLTSGKEGI